MAYNVNWEKNGVYWAFSGAFTDEDFLNCLKALFEDPRFPNIKYKIVDFTDVEIFPISSLAIQRAAVMDEKHYKNNPDLKTAIVANQTVIHGLKNQYKTYFELESNGNTWQTKIFDTIEGARKWLNIQ